MLTPRSYRKEVQQALEMALCKRFGGCVWVIAGAVATAIKAAMKDASDWRLVMAEVVCLYIAALFPDIHAPGG
jgi:hypothetical protein